MKGRSILQRILKTQAMPLGKGKTKNVQKPRGREGAPAKSSAEQVK